MKKDKFEVGNRVWDFRYGWGKVVSLSSGYIPTPIEVNFDDSTVGTYTQDGRQRESYNQSLFFQEIPIPESALVRPRWRAKRKDLYYCINNTGNIEVEHEEGVSYDDDLFNVGNYFKSEEEAKESKFYKIFHEEDDLNG